MTFMMNSNQLVIGVTLIMITQLYFLRKEWGSIYGFLKNALRVVYIFLITSLAINFYFEYDLLLKIVQIVFVGIISLFWFIPEVFDNVLILISRKELTKEYFESIVLHRNILSGIARDFYWGFRTAPRAPNFHLTRFLRGIVLAVIILMTRVVENSINLSIAAQINHFGIKSLQPIRRPSARLFWVALVGNVICIIFIMYL